MALGDQEQGHPTPMGSRSLWPFGRSDPGFRLSLPIVPPSLVGELSVLGCEGGEHRLDTRRDRPRELGLRTVRSSRGVGGEGSSRWGDGG